MTTTLLDGKYVLDRRLGGGGMAEVFLGRTVGKAGFQRPVAIKCILPHYSNDPRFVEMFISEAQLTARLRHPNIVSVLDFDQDRDRSLFLVMELVDGTDLHGLLATGPLPFDVIVYVIIEVLRGLGHAHSLPIAEDGVLGLVHRDVSPQNVLLSWEGECKVSDFGIAKARAATEASASVLIKGKPAYMSPDQANGSPLDGTSDMFSVGVMLWEMLSGQPLFASDSMEHTLKRVLFDPIVRPSIIRRDVPADLERIALRLLERDRRQRYPNADAAIAELMACEHSPRNGREALATLLAQRFPGRAPYRPAGLVLTGPDQATITPSSRLTQPARPALLSPAPSPHRRRSRVLVGAVVVVLVAAGVGIVFAVNASSSSSRDARAGSSQVMTPAPSASTQEPVQQPASSAWSAPTPTVPASAQVSGGETAAAADASKQPEGSSSPPAPAKKPNTTPRDRARSSAPRKPSGIEEIKLGD